MGLNYYWKLNFNILHNRSKHYLLSILQVRQQIAQEFEHVKDITGVLNSFKTDNVRHVSALSPYSQEEPTRDPDVWPPPNPVEHKLVFLEYKKKIVANKIIQNI